MGFHVREVAFDFKTLLRDHCRRVEFRQENAKIAADAPTKDYSIPQGKKISLSLGGKKDEAKKGKKKASSTAGLLQIPSFDATPKAKADKGASKPQSLAEDPFATSTFPAADEGGDPFAAESPFGEAAAFPSVDAAVDGGGTEDPFAAQPGTDPFQNDTFQNMAIGEDPFAAQAAASDDGQDSLQDPFASSGGDPFASSGAF